MDKVMDQPELAESLTMDRFLGGSLSVTQPRDGFRAGSDAVLLAAAVEAKHGETLLDVGTGVGTAGLCALHRLGGCTLWGIELQPELAALAIKNADANGLAEKMRIIEADIGDRKSFTGHKGPGDKLFLEAGFDHVFTNPPFYGKGRGRDAKTTGRTLARMEGSVPLQDWLQFCVARTKPKGTVTVIHRAERLHEILALLSSGCGSLKVIPLWPEAGAAAKRVIVQGIKGDKGPLELTAGLVLHETGGKPTEAAECISRFGATFTDVLSQ
tara:strand:- start:4274 stop:5083 length:810 start_codon:yes stop_codon:yes gene_type:complete